MTRIISEADVRKVVTFDRLVPAVEAAFVALQRGQAQLPAMMHFDFPEVEGEVHAKGAYLTGDSRFVIKVASGFYRNPAVGLPSNSGLVLAFSSETGQLDTIILDNGYLTEVRTAAAGAVAAKHLSHRPVDKVALIGAGSQSGYQLAALLTVCNPTSVAVWSRTATSAERFIAARQGQLPVKLAACKSVAETVEGADLVVTATPSRQPLVQLSWLATGAHVTAVGADVPTKQELEPAVLGRADLVVVDNLAQCLDSGELHHAVDAGAIDPSAVVELGAVLAGDLPGRNAYENLTVCDLTGVGVQDAAAASVALEELDGMGTTGIRAE